MRKSEIEATIPIAVEPGRTNRGKGSHLFATLRSLTTTIVEQ
jgi:hypothetical protein